MKKRWKIIGLVVLIIVVAVGITSLFIYKSVQHLGDELIKQMESALKLADRIQSPWQRARALDEMAYYVELDPRPRTKPPFLAGWSIRRGRRN